MHIKRGIPHLFTAGNLFCGLTSLLLLANGKPGSIIYLVSLALFFDLIDGLAARLLKVQSEFGKQFDSLADMITFGVLPGFLLFYLVKSSYPENFNLLHGLPTMIVPIFAAVRLGVFNIDQKQKEGFLGLPTPAMAVIVLTLYHYENHHYLNWLQNPVGIYIVSMLLSVLMVSRIPMISMKFKNFEWRENKYRYLLIAISVTSLILFKLVIIPYLLPLYIILSLLESNQHKV